MITIQSKNFSALQICMSGQCFRMEACGENRYRLVAKGKYLELAQQEEDILFDCTQEEYHTVWKDYFDMETDYAQIIAGIDAEDTYLSAAADYGKGIRILHQDLWEMIISFLISQQNNIKRIRKCINQLCEKYGEKERVQMACHTMTFRRHSPWQRRSSKICMPVVWGIVVSIFMQLPTAYIPASLICQRCGQ